MIIRKEQFQIFKNLEIKKFEYRMQKHLRLIFPAETMEIEDDKLLQLIQSGILNSKKYGLKMEWDIRRYLECSVLYGWDFDENTKTSWAMKILNNQKPNAREKMDEIELFDNNFDK